MYLLGYHGKYLGADLQGNANANLEKPGAWGTWTLIDLNGGVLQSGDKIQLLSHHNRYLVAGSDGSANANSQQDGEQETWTVTFQ